jgi:hypothetical protein
MSTLLAEFQDWIEKSKPGQSFTYATCGSLGDKGLSGDTLSTAEHAKRMFARGLIELAQSLRKDTDGNRAGFDYLAIKRKESRVPLVFGNPWVPKIVGPGRSSWR